MLVLCGAGLAANAPKPMADYVAGDAAARGGVRVAAADVNGDGDGAVDLVTGDGDGARTLARPAPATLLDGDFSPGFLGGVFVG